MFAAIAAAFSVGVAAGQPNPGSTCWKTALLPNQTPDGCLIQLGVVGAVKG